MAGINIIDTASTDRTITGINVIDSAGTDRALVQINAIGPDGTDRVVWAATGGSGVAVSVTPASASGASRGQTTITTSPVTADASGGTGPYTYSWSLIERDSVTAPSADAAASAMTTFTLRNVGYGEENTATFRVIAQDSLGATGTADVLATWSNSRL